MVKQIESKPEFESAVKEAPIVVVDFFAVWCGPCRMIAPVIEKIETELQESNPDKVAFFKVDVDQLQELAEEMKISAMPTFLVFHNGVLDETIVGANAPKIQQHITELLAKPQ